MSPFQGTCGRAQVGKHATGDPPGDLVAELVEIRVQVLGPGE